MEQLGIDISSYQGKKSVVDFIEYAKWAKQWTGQSFLIMKATEGNGITDPDYQSNVRAAIAAQVDVIFHYHFARQDLGNTSANEVKYFMNVVGNLKIRPFDQIMLDMECAGGDGLWAYSWLRTVELAYGRKPWIYSSRDYALNHLHYRPLANYPWIMADYTYSEFTRPAPVYPWEKVGYAAIQYTDKAHNIPGFPTNEDLDCNVFLHVNKRIVSMYATNPIIKRQFDSRWDSTAFMFAGIPVRRNTAIHDSWVTAWEQGHQFGPPIQQEMPETNANNENIIVQVFAHATAEHNTKSLTTRWFGPTGEIKL